MSRKGPAPIQSPVYDLYKNDPSIAQNISSGISQVFSPNADDAYSKIATERLISSTRGGYGARGLAGSGIAQKGEQDAVAGLQATLQQQKLGVIPQVIGAFAGQPAQQQQATPRGLFGLK
jgi:hypothetical protein